MQSLTPSSTELFTFLMGWLTAEAVFGWQLLLGKTRVVTGAATMYIIGVTVAVLPFFDLWAHLWGPLQFAFLVLYSEALRRLVLFLVRFLTSRSRGVSVRSASALPTILRIAEDCTGLPGAVFVKRPRMARKQDRIIVWGTRWRGVGVLFPRSLTAGQNSAFASAVGVALGHGPRLQDRPLEAYILGPVCSFLLGVFAIAFYFA